MVIAAPRSQLDGSFQIGNCRREVTHSLVNGRPPLISQGILLTLKGASQCGQRFIRAPQIKVNNSHSLQCERVVVLQPLDPPEIIERLFVSAQSAINPATLDQRCTVVRVSLQDMIEMGESGRVLSVATMDVSPPQFDRGIDESRSLSPQSAFRPFLPATGQ